MKLQQITSRAGGQRECNLLVLLKQKNSLLLKDGKQRCHEVWFDAAWLFTESLSVPTAMTFLKNET